MSITLKSLIFILLIGIVYFWLARRLINTDVLSNKDFNRWRNLWFLLQTLAFTLPNLWVFYSCLFLICILLIPKKTEVKIASYCFLLSTLPLLAVNIPGFGITNYLFTFNFPRALSLFILLPTFFILRQHNSKKLRLFTQPADKFVISFLLLTSFLDFRDDSLTNGIRFLFLNFIDFFLPYYVISRSITNIKSLNKILIAILLSISLSAFIGIFEAVKHWHIYNHLVQHLQDLARLHSSDVRGGILRAAATFMTPIALGYVITIGFGIYLYLYPLITNKNLRKIIPLGLILGLLATVSRGPWVGFIFLCLVYIWTGKEKTRQYFKILSGFILTLPLLLFTESGQKFVDLLPFIGTIRSDTIEYRDRLMEMSSIVIKQNPLFGSTTFLDTPEMISMTQGEGIIDIVNTYLQITLQYGLISLILFASIFITLLWEIHKLINQLPKKELALIRLGRSLFSTLSAVALIIYTVSYVDYIPYYYWMLFGLSTSFIFICIQKRNSLN